MTQLRFILFIELENWLFMDFVMVKCEVEASTVFGPLEMRKLFFSVKSSFLHIFAVGNIFGSLASREIF